MKNLYLAFCICLSFIVPASAQNDFAPTGSEWYHTMPYGAFHSYYSGDTIINGQACRAITRKALTADPWYSLGLHVSNHITGYVYNTADTVFVYNSIFHKFTPLYVFNVQDGDTVRLPILPIDDGHVMFIEGVDSTFSFRVDSVRMKVYDTATLKTVYTSSIGTYPGRYVYNYCADVDSQGMYAQRMGSVHFGLMPQGLPSIRLATESIQDELSLKCYNDPTLSIKLVPGICGIPTVGVTPIDQKVPVTLFPDPANDVLNINCPGMGNTSMAIIDMTGREVVHTAASNGSFIIRTASLPAGIYVVRLTTDDSGTTYHKFVIVH